MLKADGADSLIEIKGGSTDIKNSSFQTGNPGGKILIHSGFTSEGCYIKAHESRSVVIGEDCMFSAGINLSTTDFHSILSLSTGERINTAADISIGNHVWLGRNVNVLKGTTITEGIVIGMGSTASGKITNPNSIYVGSPARCIKEGISWRRELL